MWVSSYNYYMQVGEPRKLSYDLIKQNFCILREANF